MTYKLRFPTNSLKKKFDKKVSQAPKQTQEKISKALNELRKNPRPKGKPKIKPPVSVAAYLAQHRKRIGNYRILYDLDDKNKIIWLLAFRGRNEKTYRKR